MGFNIQHAFIFSLALACADAPAQAATMTFDGLDPYGVNFDAYTYEEDGIVLTSEYRFSHYRYSFDSLGFGAIGNYYQNATFTMDSNFDASSFDILNWRFDAARCYEGVCETITLPSVSVQGFRESTLVASLLFDPSISVSPYSVALGIPFSNLSALVISMAFSSYGEQPDGSRITCGDRCASFSIDNVTLSPVPIPAAFPLLLGGLALMGGMARLKARRKEDRV